MKKSNLNVVAEVKLSYNTRGKLKRRPVVRKSTEMYQLLKDNWEPGTLEYYETFKVILMNSANKVLGILPLSTGGSNGTTVDLKMLVFSIVRSAATQIAICHNHASGNTNPSRVDLATTTRIKDACQLIDVDLVDHLVISADGYFSFADNGVL